MDFIIHIFRQKKYAVSIFFISWIAIGLSIHQDFGISMDESVERMTGLVSTKYIANRLSIEQLKQDRLISQETIPELHNYADKYFGPFFAITSVVLERIFNIGNGNDETKIYEFRHLLTFIFSVCGGWAIYQMASRRFESWWIGIFCLALFITTPRLFAESFYNNKDLVFLSLFALAANATIQLVLRPRIITAIIASLFTAAAIDTRVAAIFLLVICLVTFTIRIIQRELQFKQILLPIIIYLGLSALFVILFWPLLWSSPIENFLAVLQNFSRWTRSTLTILFLGTEISSTAIPWYYIPLYILFTTPVIFIIFFLLGLYKVAKEFFINLFKKHQIWNDEFQMQDLFFIGCFFVPIISAILLNSVVYDGWRHLYFTYPFLLLLAMVGIKGFYYWSITKDRIVSLLMFFVFGLALSFNIFWMIISHPYQFAYFNSLAGKGWITNFDVDYWGLGSKDAFNFVLKNDSREIINIYPDSFLTLTDSLRVLPINDRRRIQIVDDPNQADYLFTNYRQNGALSYWQNNTNKFIKVHDLKVDDEVIYTILKRRLALRSESLSSGHRIDFSISGLNSLDSKLNETKTYIYGEGWSSLESWGMWSEESKAALSIPIDAANNIKAIVIDGRGFITPNHPKQEIIITANGVKLETIYLKNHYPTRLYIPLSKLNLSSKDSILHLEFEFPNRISPEAIGAGPDRRTLAFGISTVLFE